MTGSFRVALPTRPVWRQAVRMTVAALFAYLGTVWFGLAEGYWAVITCLVIVQSTLGGTLNAAVSRINGTVAGAVLGGMGAWVQGQLGVPHAAMLLALVLPLSLAAAANAQFRMAPVTAALVLLAIHVGGGSFNVALYRIADIALGGVVGAAAALFVLPERAASRMVAHGAATLAALGELARLYLTGQSGADALGDQVQGLIFKTQAACAEAVRERAFHLADGPPPEPLLLTLRRLRTDVVMIGQVVAAKPGDEHVYASIADAIADWFTAASRSLESGDAPPDFTPIDRACEDIPPGSALRLVHTILRQDLVDLCAQITERRRSRP
jgi:uncharacterized membrane protein YccC